MNNATKKNKQTLKVNGVEFRALKGGFLAYHRDRNAPKIIEEATEPANGDSAAEEPECQYFLCNTCGTVITVYGSKRKARCCKQDERRISAPCNSPAPPPTSAITVSVPCC